MTFTEWEPVSEADREMETGFHFVSMAEALAGVFDFMAPKRKVPERPVVGE